jgi:hypothetical protein
MILNKREITVNGKRKRYIALSGERGMEEAIDLSQDRLQSE